MDLTDTPKSRKGRLTRSAILHEAVQLASVHGLEGLSIGQLAEATGMSKAGLFAHFGSKEELQLATVHAARGIFVEEVVVPSLDAPEGLPRLVRVIQEWFRYGCCGVFRGGCFFAAASAEFDGRPGPVRDSVAAARRDWIQGLAQTIAQAQALGQLDPAAEPLQLAFEIDALFLAANSLHQLDGDPTAFERARTGIRTRLAGCLTPGNALEPL